MKVIEKSGNMEAPVDAGRYTTWMPQSDRALRSWFNHFTAKGIACAIVEDGGRYAVFRSRNGMVDPPK